MRKAPKGAKRPFNLVFHVKLDPYATLDRLTRAQRRDLETYARILAERALPLGLVAASDGARIWERHVLDSLRAIGCLADARAVADLGSGAGLPGIPVAIARPDCEVALIESRHRRAAFLEWVVEQLGLRSVHVIPIRAKLVAATFDACLARALGDAESSWRLGERLIPEGRLVYFAGTTFRLDRCAIPGVDCGICLEGKFPWQGPLVMMTRSQHRTI